LTGALGQRETAELAAASRTSPRYLAELRAACPDPLHAPAYAALLLEARVCRAVSAYAAAVSLEASQLRSQVGRLAQASGVGNHPADRYAAQMKLIAADMRRFSAWFNPDKTGAVTGPPAAPADGRGRDEETMLAVLIQQRPEAGQLMRMLHATVFTDPLRQQVFLAIEILHAFGQPIDELTVDWELVRALASVGVKPANIGSAVGQPSYVMRLATANFGREETARAAGALGERLAGTLGAVGHDRGPVPRMLTPTIRKSDRHGDSEHRYCRPPCRTGAARHGGSAALTTRKTCATCCRKTSPIHATRPSSPPSRTETARSAASYALDVGLGFATTDFIKSLWNRRFLCPRYRAGVCDN